MRTKRYKKWRKRRKKLRKQWDLGRNEKEMNIEFQDKRMKIKRKNDEGMNTKTEKN